MKESDKLLEKIKALENELEVYKKKNENLEKKIVILQNMDEKEFCKENVLNILFENEEKERKKKRRKKEKKNGKMEEDENEENIKMTKEKKEKTKIFGSPSTKTTQKTKNM